MPNTRRPPNQYTQLITLPFSHGSVSATTTVKLWKTSTSRRARVARVNYCNPTGLAANASNFFDVRIVQGSTIAAKWSSNTTPTGDGAIAANAPFDLVLQTASGANFAPVSTEISLVLNLTGTATIPAGIGLVEIELL